MTASAPPLVPPFPLLGEPGEWDALTLVAATCFLEAEGEPFDGVLGVGYVIRRRALDWGLGWHAAVLGPGGRAYDDGKPFEPISAFNDDYRTRAHARLSTITPEGAEPAWRAAAGALWGMLSDPTGQAAFYLNVPVTLKIRGGTLPTWAASPDNPAVPDPAKITVVLGRHTFMR